VGSRKEEEGKKIKVKKNIEKKNIIKNEGEVEGAGVEDDEIVDNEEKQE
jgi:hypothetical protein